jgi:peptide/nickel transport system substrate-binding protein
VIKPLSENSSFNWIRQEQYGEIGFLLMNQAKEGPLQDQRIRCAIAGAIEKEVLIAATSAGFQEPATGMMSPGQEGFLEEDVFPAYDIDAAKALVDEYKAEKGVDTVTFLYSTAQSTSNQATAQYLQTELAKIGIDMEIRQIEQSALVNEAITGADTFEMFLWRLHAGIYVDQQNFWWNSASVDPASPLSLNFGRVQDEEIDRLLAEARSEADPAARKAIAEDINRRMGEQCWYVPTAFTRWGIHAVPAVSGFGRLPIPGTDTTARDGAGFPGQVMVHTLFKAAS